MAGSAPLEELVVTLAATWPALRIDGAVLAAALDDRGIAASSTYAPDVALALALAARDPGALEVFEATIVPDIKGAIVRFRKDTDFVDEVLQRVRVKLLVSADGAVARIAEYRGRGSLAAWVQIVAIREALMIQRARRREVPGDDELLRIAVAAPAHVLVRSREVYKEAFASAFRAAFAELDEHPRTILRLCFVEGVGTEDLARLFRVHRVTAFRWLRDARETLLERTRAKFLRSAGVPASEVDGLMRSLAGSLSVVW